MDAFVGLGSNLGDPLAQLHAATAALGWLGPIRQRSAVYKTAPVGGPPQPDYLNAALWLSVPLEPHELLAELQKIEERAGRVRVPGQRNSPRVLDLDVLLLGEHGERVIVSADLMVPHPRLHQRAFALRPLLDLVPGLVHPALGVSLRDLLRALPPADTEPPPRPIGWL
jgi:2-amino-4-hydroxy-6-hydroxymethyldihydropteridine diphosphokinase